MFLPDDLTTDEATLAETARRQLRSSRRPRTPAEWRAVEQEADQVAAEIVEAARVEPEGGEDAGGPLTPDEARWQRIRRAVAELDGSSGSLADLVAMEEHGQAAGEWLPAGESSPPSRP